MEKIKSNIYAVDGTPADCVYLALKKFIPRKPDLLISGMNHGPNLGQQDISYSGTVSAAIQGMFLQVPSMAVSLIADAQGQFHFDQASQIVFLMAQQLLKKRIPTGVVLNVNIPPPPIKGIKLTELGQKRYDPEIIEKKDPREKSYFWIGTGSPKSLGGQRSDIHAVHLGYISVTPLHTDLTDYKTLESSLFSDLFARIEHETTSKTL